MKSRKIVYRVLIGCMIVIMMGFIMGCEHGEEHTPPTNVAGLWTVIGIWPNKAEVEFTQDDQIVDALIAKGKTFWTFKGRMDGDALSGTFVATSGDQPITINAKVVANDMRGSWVRSSEKGSFTATRK